ncbi:hypothetical protein CR203_23450 [Salipaludibacillus neizhouensis]|uniref:Uncharacterized protein n=1 Tax=Salipaludibacillus neizhouensis TaxID=885475 RepID=A0A3A9JWW9_9BACI|nr:hypothetical protein [Salipaludibacillus neizhouensis]RKL64967.1 hypothetical protein CR203_23450 [Salipaludibacillus neizhouensis]
MNSKNPYLLEIKKDFANGIISYQDFLKEHSAPRSEWNDVKILARDTALLKKFLLKLPIGLRLKAAMYTHDLNFPDIKKMGIDGADTFITAEYPNNSTRGFSYKLFRLAIILDIPFEYVSSPLTHVFEGHNDGQSFIEYFTFSEVSQIEKLIKELEKPSSRIIEGYIIDYSPFYISDLAKVRIDRRVEFFCLEFFYNNKSSFQIGSFVDIAKLFEQRKLKYIIETPVTGNLREKTFKINFIGLYDTIPHSINTLKNHKDELMLRTGSKLIYPLF